MDGELELQSSLNLPIDGLWLPEAASTTAGGVDQTFWLIYWVCVVAFLLVVIPMTAFMFVYKRKTPDQKALSQADHSQLLEILWSAVPTVFFVVIFVVGFRGFLNLYVPPAGAMEVQITGKKWDWTMQYPCGASIGGKGAEFPMPLNKPVKGVVTSVDVLHSFFIPNFRTKIDAVPYRYTTLWWQPTKEGTFPVFCTEYCGKDHSNMLAKIKVMPEAEWNAWYEKTCAEAGGPASAEAGEKIYSGKGGCIACHSIDGTRRVGPSFKGLFGKTEKLQGGATVKVDEDYIMESILEPNKKIVESYPPSMPAMGQTLSKSDIDSVILYIKSLK
jgi:cytochrome c oxidase subunit 2